MMVCFCVLYAWFVFYLPNYSATPTTTSRPIRR